MKRLISALLTLAMLCSVIPTIAFAENGETQEGAVQEAQQDQEAKEGLGIEAEIDNTLYYIEDGTLFASENSARPYEVDTNVSWVIAKNGSLYWSKIDEHNTTEIYSTITGENEVFAKVFVPVEAFDVNEDELYYLYNGEIDKLNVTTSEEETVINDKSIKSFYLNNSQVFIFNEKTNGLTMNEGIDLFAHSYSSDYKYWSQGASGYWRVKKYGCEIVAMARMIYESGIDRSAGFNPDVFAKWEEDNGHITSLETSIGQNNQTGPQEYAKQKGKVLNYLGYEPYSSDGLWNAIRNGYYCILSTNEYSGSHYVFIANQESISSGQLKFYESWSSSTSVGIRNLSEYSYINGFFKYKTDKNTTPSISSGTKPKQTTTNTPKSNAVVNPTVSVNLTTRPTEIYVGHSSPMRGSITSNYPIYYVSGTIVDSGGGNVIPWINMSYNGTKSITIGQNHALNTKMTFDSIKSPGNYKIRIIVNCNSNGAQENVKTFDFPFTVKTEQQCEAPSIYVSSIEEGQRVTFNCNDSSGTIHYSIDGLGEQTCRSGATKDFTAAGNYNISAYVTRANYNQGPTVNRTVSVSKVPTPVIGDVKYGTSNAWVTISGNGTINYTDNGRNPSKSSNQYNGTIYLNNSATIKAMASQYGKVNSDIASKYMIVAAPDMPTGLSLYNTKAKIAQGKTATVQWNAMDRATSYEARLYYNGQQVGKTYETKGTTAAFKLTDVGVYSIKVAAKNFKGTSAESAAVTVESMAPVTVTFVDRVLREGNVTDEVVDQIQENVDNHFGDDTFKVEGNVLSVQTIDYDSKPSMPTWEDRTGFSRQYFSGEAYLDILQDTTVYAYYKVKSFNVSFWEYWSYDSTQNGQIGNTQNILYSFSAEAPSVTNVPPGYTLAGWNVDSNVSDCYDFTFVEGKMKLYTSYAWENDDLPVVLEVVKAKRGNTCQSYSIDLRYINNDLEDTQARIIVSLYTDEGKMVYTTVEDVDLMPRDPGIYYTESIQADYPNIVSKITAVMVQVKDDKTGGAVSEMVETTDIEMPDSSTTWTNWSSWSTADPGTQPARYNDVKGIQRQVETKPQYRYRNKQYTTTNNSKSLSGWTYLRTDSSTGGWTYNGTSYVAEENSEYRRREVKPTWHDNYKTQWLYSRYVYNGRVQPYQSSSYTYYEDTGWHDYALPFEHYVTFANGGTYASYNPYWSQQAINDGIATRDRNWYNEQTRSVKNGGYNTYEYRDTYYTHHFWKWGTWSDWSDTYRSGDATETRTVYRWRDEFANYPEYDPARDSTNKDETITTYDLSGNIPGLENDFGGKLATVLVYKKTNTDPTQEQLEYVDQITLGENNYYEFTVNPKEEISYEDTGDYVVTLSIEGCEKLVNLDVIKAPVPECIVTFMDTDGNVLKDSYNEDMILSVAKGGSLDAYDIPVPQKEGYRFVKWDTSLVNINDDITVSPIYEKKAYNVVFVDYENQTAEMKEVYYGDPIELPEVAPIEGKEFKGWDIDSYRYSADGDIDTEIFNVREDIPYYKTTDDNYILTTEYDPEIHDIVDTTEYYKYFSDSNMTITESKIVTAKWDDLTYTVSFCDLDGNVIAGELGTQEVKYGESAQLPELVERDGKLYSWDITGNAWWNVTNDMIVTPYVPQEVEVDAPTISAPTNNAYGEYTAELESSVENGKIYYCMDIGITEDDARKFIEGKVVEEESEIELQSISLMDVENEEGTEFEEVDGSDEYGDTPIDFITEYTEPISVYAGNVVYAFTVDEDGNISPISVFQYEANYSEEMFGDSSNEYVPDPNSPQITMSTITAQPGETVTIPVNIKNNMGINNLEILLGYDTDDLILENVQNGNVFEDSEFTFDTREDGSCKFIWETGADNTNDGTLMNLTFTVKDTATKSKYMLDLGVEYSADENDEEWYFITVPGAITGEEQVKGTPGDVNGDEDVDFADAILIIRYDAGLTEFTDDQTKSGDVNGDGEVDFADAILVIKYDAGLIDEFSR